MIAETCGAATAERPDIRGATPFAAWLTSHPAVYGQPTPATGTSTVTT
jgi:hypothetical protein